jgi:hypothetical protein
MQPRHRRAGEYFCILAFVLVALMTSCRTWVAESGRSGTGPAPQLEGPIRVTRADKSTVILFDVVVSGDSLIGFTRGDSSRRFAMPLTEVNKIETRQLQRSVVYVQYYLLIVGGVGLAALAWALR